MASQNLHRCLPEDLILSLLVSTQQSTYHIAATVISKCRPHQAITQFLPVTLKINSERVLHDLDSPVPLSPSPRCSPWPCRLFSLHLRPRSAVLAPTFKPSHAQCLWPETPLHLPTWLPLRGHQILVQMFLPLQRCLCDAGQGQVSYCLLSVFPRLEHDGLGSICLPIMLQTLSKQGLGLPHSSGHPQG